MKDSLSSTQRGGVRSDSRSEWLRCRSLVDLLRGSSIKLRSLKVINELVPLLQDLPFFTEFANNFKLLQEVAQKVEYRHCKQGDHIYRFRESAHYFYIVLQGCVELTIPEEIEDEDEEGEEEMVGGGPRTLKDLLELKEERDRKEKEKEKMTANQATEQGQEIISDKIIGTIQRGGCFGEMMGESSIRATNAVAVDQCHLLAISRRAYEVLLKAQLRTDKRSKYLFLSSLPILAPLQAFALQSICLRLTEKELAYGQALFQQGQEINQIFIVQSGEFKLLKSVNKHSACAVERRTHNKSEYQTLTLPTKEVPFAIVQSGEILGDGQVLALQTRYQQRCVCHSQTAKIFSIDKRQYFKQLSSDKQCFTKLKKAIQQKHRRRWALASELLQRRSRQSQMNVLLNSNEWAVKPKQFVIRDPHSSLHASSSSLTSEQIAGNQSFFLNELNRTLQQNIRPNRFSINKKKCYTEGNTSAHDKLSPMILGGVKREKEGIPHCVQDIVSIVKLKANFLRRFRKERRRERNVFKFDKQAVPLFIKCKYNKLEEQ